MRKAIFLDKDGTLISDIPYNVDPSLITLEPSAAEAIRQWKEQGYLVIVVSNQSGIARGYFNESAMEKIILRLQELLQQEGADLDAFYYCPHHPEGYVAPYARLCDCRKPEPGMLLQAAREWNINLNESWMIGDILHDVEAGNSAGCKTILIDNGHETEWQISDLRKPTSVAYTLSEAAGIILQSQLRHYA
jgi:D-glycero-D-manno-heptose 1,7-bisphosphate phosphatase